MSDAMARMQMARAVMGEVELAIERAKQNAVSRLCSEVARRPLDRDSVIIQAAIIYAYQALSLEIRQQYTNAVKEAEKYAEANK
jgi:hypothetical protein